ncbi:MAG: phosphate propanoyltransferase [Eubacteriales bacterium]|nr:phosphate propanoyltransferase [Eubacteriales bacterium]
MEKKHDLTEQITDLVIKNLAELTENPYYIPVGISARHVHLTRADVDTLFGKGYQLTKFKDLSQPGQFAANEKVTIEGVTGKQMQLRILGPERSHSQVELAFSETRGLGIQPPVRSSGNISGTPGIKLIGPKGSVILKEGVIIADRHIHMTPADAKWFGVTDGERVEVVIPGQKGGVMNEVLIRVSDTARLDFHIDVDDANAFLLKQGQKVWIRRKEAEYDFRNGERKSCFHQKM